MKAYIKQGIKLGSRFYTNTEIELMAKKLARQVGLKPAASVIGKTTIQQAYFVVGMKSAVKQKKRRKK